MFNFPNIQKSGFFLHLSKIFSSIISNVHYCLRAVTNPKGAIELISFKYLLFNYIFIYIKYILCICMPMYYSIIALEV